MRNTTKTRLNYAIVLLKELVRTDFKLRYQGSVLGYLWSILKPLFLFGTLYFVFVVIVGVEYGVENDGVYLLLGIVLWTFFTELSGGSVMSVVSKGDLIRKLNFPKYIIVFATGFSAFINLSLNMMIVVVFMMIGGITVNLLVLLAPLLFLELFMFTMGVGFFLSTSFVRFRDIGYIWDVVTQALFYLTPILFPLAIAPLWVQKVLMINPAAQIIQDLRYILVSTDTTTITNVYNGNELIRIVPITIAVVVFSVSALYFRSNSKNFAENI